jgi:hypothetical protein
MIPTSETPAPSDTEAILTAMDQESAALKTASGRPILEMVADWIAPQYAVAARACLAAEQDPAQRLKILRRFICDWTLLRRSHELATQRSKDQMEATFKIWMKRPENQPPPPRKMTQEEKARKMAEILSITGDPPVFHPDGRVDLNLYPVAKDGAGEDGEEEEDDSDDDYDADGNPRPDAPCPENAEHRTSNSENE